MILLSFKSTTFMPFNKDVDINFAELKWKK